MSVVLNYAQIRLTNFKITCSGSRPNIFELLLLIAYSLVVSCNYAMLADILSTMYQKSDKYTVAISNLLVQRRGFPQPHLVALLEKRFSQDKSAAGQ